MRGWRGPRIWRAKRAEWSGGVSRRRSMLAAKPPAVAYKRPDILKTTTLRSWPAFAPPCLAGRHRSSPFLDLSCRLSLLTDVAGARHLRRGSCGTDVSPNCHPSPGIPVPMVLALRHPPDGRPLPHLSNARFRSRWFVVTYVASVPRYPCVRSVPRLEPWSTAPFPRPPISSARPRPPPRTPNFPPPPHFCPVLVSSSSPPAPAPPPTTTPRNPWCHLPDPSPHVVGGEGSGGWHPSPRPAPRFAGGGAGARIPRAYSRSPAFNPAWSPVLNPAFLARHPRRQGSPLRLLKSCPLVRTDQLALFWMRRRRTRSNERASS